MASRPSSGTGSGYGRNSATNRPKSVKKQSGGANVTQQLLSKEEEYMRLNAEIEERTASLIKEAEQVIHGQEEIFSRPVSDTNVSSSLDLEEILSTSLDAPTSTSQQIVTNNRPQSTNKKRPKSKSERPKSAAAKPKNSKAVDMAADVDVLAERINLVSKITSLEDEANQDGFDSTATFTDNILPSAAQDMGSEATIRFLKAKLHVMQEEMDRLSSETSKKDDEMASLQNKVKQFTEEQTRQQKTNTALQAQIDKYKKLYSESKGKNDSLEQLLSSTKKELDGVQREQKHFVSNKNAVEVRLNRALEEVEKYKSALHKAKTSSKDTSDQERRRLDQLLAENKRLEKQKNELMTGFKKQMKLIDILKRQKMHIEAAKLLQFSEEEFVKALDWGN